MRVEIEEIRRAYETAREALLSERSPDGFWTGRLSASALSTATAVSALCVAAPGRFDRLIRSGARWLVENQNANGGWGDTTDSPSNLATTMLAQAALRLAPDAPGSAESYWRADDYLSRMAGQSMHSRVQSLRESYGNDRTFAVPILANCAVAGLIEWAEVPPLPFELARLPRAWLGTLRLHVVSYALPALIAIGQLIHRRNPTGNPLSGILRDGAVEPTLERLAGIQPANGGFLEAIPLTSFVVMSLSAAGRAGHPVVVRGADFLEKSARADGSWPIDTNLSTWVTTQAVEALAAGGPPTGAAALKQWLLDQQRRTVNSYTDAQPGGWAWTNLPGGVPDADDTSGALLALAHLGGAPAAEAVSAGVTWLLDLQNPDGGWPTFCRGWGRLSFDRSAPDLTAHAIRAIRMWHGSVDVVRERRAVRRGLGFLGRTQRSDGSWLPLWFGNQRTPDQSNPVYGTARALAAYRDLGRAGCVEAQRGAAFLRAVQNDDGGWGGARGAPSTIEETALAVSALEGLADTGNLPSDCLQGCTFLTQLISEGGLAESAPIGLYFARLWYSERLYPMIWSVAALGSALARAGSHGQFLKAELNA